MARPGRLELPTLCLEGTRSIQLSYGRTFSFDSKAFRLPAKSVLEQGFRGKTADSWRAEMNWRAADANFSAPNPYKMLMYFSGLPNI